MTSVIINKKIFLNKNFMCSFKKENDLLSFVFFFRGSLFLKLVIKDNFLVKNNVVYFFNASKFAVYALTILKKIYWNLINLSIFNYSFFVKLNVIGLGYKNFVINNKLFLLLGDCNYIILDIPMSVTVFCKKKQIYLLGFNKDDLFNFANKIKLIKNINYYKGKGILEFNNFKFMKLKTGKKQRFM